MVDPTQHLLRPRDSLSQDVWPTAHAVCLTKYSPILVLKLLASWKAGVGQVTANALIGWQMAGGSCAQRLDGYVELPCRSR